MMDNDAILVTLFDGWVNGAAPGPGLGGCCWVAGPAGGGGADPSPFIPHVLPRSCSCLSSIPASRCWSLLSSQPPPAPGASCSYDDAEIALQCGQMFRDCIRHEAVAGLVLSSHLFTDMFGKLELSNFEVASGEGGSLLRLLLVGGSGLPIGGGLAGAAQLPGGLG